MRQLFACALIATLLRPATTAQSLDKELVASLSGPALGQGVVSELLWDGGTLIVQSAAVLPGGQLMPRYFAAPAANMNLQRLAGAPASAERYWQMKSSRVSPTRLGTITAGRDSEMPMFGIGRQENRLLNAAELGGMNITHEFHLGKTLIHRRKSAEPPYDGEVWGWSGPELNRIAYVDQKGDLWIAGADGRRAERILRGPVTLPAWSDDGRLIAVSERKDDGARWDVSIVRVPERLRQ